MYKILKIGGKDYKLEYSIEAALYADCAEVATNLFVGVGIAAQEKDFGNLIKQIPNLPGAALTMFYAGLLEHHGLEEGDGTVPDKATAKNLMKVYLSKSSNDGSFDFYGFALMLLEKMGDDNFFKTIGLEDLIARPEETEEKQSQPPIALQDHKPPKGKKVSEK